MSEFSEGVRTGFATNPFTQAVDRVNQIVDEKRQFDKKLESEAVNLANVFKQLEKKHELDVDLQNKKIEQENLTQQNGTNQSVQLLKTLQDMGIFPPGSSASLDIGGVKINTPLNREFTGEEQRVIAGSENVTNSVDKALSFVNEGGVDGLINQIRADVGNPLFVSGNLEDFTTELNNLKAIIPFAKGGKQLTPFEAKLLFRLVETKGKERDTIVKDLQRFKNEFNKLSSLATGGQGSLNQPAGGQNQTQSNVVIMQDASGKKAKVEVDANGNPIRVIEEL